MELSAVHVGNFVAFEGRDRPLEKISSLGLSWFIQSNLKVKTKHQI